MAISKLIAAREKDLDFIGGLLRHHLAQSELIRERLKMAPISDEAREICIARLDRLASGVNLGSE